MKPKRRDPEKWKRQVRVAAREYQRRLRILKKQMKTDLKLILLRMADGTGRFPVAVVFVRVGEEKTRDVTPFRLRDEAGKLKLEYVWFSLLAAVDPKGYTEQLRSLGVPYEIAVSEKLFWIGEGSEEDTKKFRKAYKEQGWQEKPKAAAKKSGRRKKKDEENPS